MRTVHLLGYLKEDKILRFLVKIKKLFSLLKVSHFDISHPDVQKKKSFLFKPGPDYDDVMLQGQSSLVIQP